jgi:p-cumate 2,3-dioxygenase beta subunit
MTRAEAEDFLYHEAALLDAWKLDDWLALLTEDVCYLVPSNDVQGGNPGQTLYLIADDYARVKGRVARLKDPMAHVEFPHSRTRRMLTNVRIERPSPQPSPLGEGLGGGEFNVHANFTVHRFRRGGHATQFVGRYNYRIRLVEGRPRIAVREAVLDAEELGNLGAVSFIL